MGELLSRERVAGAFPAGGLFRDEVSWLLSPRPLALHKKQVRALEGLGHVLARFQEASDRLYRSSFSGGGDGWLARLLDTGKPGWLTTCAAARASGCLPRVIRPDLIVTDDGWALTELDSLPGGQGVTAFLSALYADAGWEVLGGRDGVVDGFRRAHPDGADIVVSEESRDYMAEMSYLADRLGDGYACLRAEEYAPAAGRMVYRFFELFDTGRVPVARELIERWSSGELEMSPPPVPHVEEKLWLALFHTPGLQAEWRRHLREAHRKRLQAMIPHSWVVDPEPLPPRAAMPWLDVHSWGDVAGFSQRERHLVLKISGFHERAWGSRGVVVGHDVSSEEWEVAVNHALLQYDLSPWILQEFRAGAIVEHPYYDGDTGELRVMRGRVRLCPYYYRMPDGATRLGGCLATIVPAEKKKIHGMKDGILVPCTMS